LFLAQIDYHLHRGELRLLSQVEIRYKAHHANFGSYNAHLERQILVGLARAAIASSALATAETLAIELARHEPPDFFSRGWGAAVSGELWCAQSLYDRAEAALSEALSYATRPGQRSYKLELRAQNALAELALHRKSPDRAKRAAEHALALARNDATRNEYEEVWALRTLTEVAISDGQRGAAESHAASLAVLAMACENPLFIALAQKAHGDVQKAFGEHADATTRIAEARALFDSLGYRPSTLTPSTRAGSSVSNTTSPWPREPGSRSTANAETLIENLGSRAPADRETRR
jgi:hypothetical protein